MEYKVWRLILTVLVCLGLVIPVTAAGEEIEEHIKFGPRVGVGFKPDQVGVGVQALLGEVVTPLRLMPSIDAGFGSDTTLVAVNADFRLPVLSPPGTNAGLYLSAGPTVQYTDPDAGDSDIDIGLSLNAGLQLRMGRSNLYTLEGRYGIDNVQDVRIVFGILF